MKKSIYVLPIILATVLILVNWGCEKDDKDEDVCEAYPKCEVFADACCPLDGSCYYAYKEQKFYCDATKATDNDPDGCNPAIESLLTAMCPTTKSLNQNAVVELRMLTQRLLSEARYQSLCNDQL